MLYLTSKYVFFVLFWTVCDRFCEVINLLYLRHIQGICHIYMLFEIIRWLPHCGIDTAANMFLVFIERISFVMELFFLFKKANVFSFAYYIKVSL